MVSFLPTATLSCLAEICFSANTVDSACRHYVCRTEFGRRQRRARKKRHLLFVSYGDGRVGRAHYSHNAAFRRHRENFQRQRRYSGARVAAFGANPSFTADAGVDVQGTDAFYAVQRRLHNAVAAVRIGKELHLTDGTW